jgi:hypothetical protein
MSGKFAGFAALAFKISRDYSAGFDFPAFHLSDCISAKAR